MVVSLIQGVLGNPFGNAASGPAFGLLNEVLSEFRSRDGIARPARYEVVIGSPPRLATDNKGARNVSLKCESISFPGRNIDTTTDTNIYGPTREIASGFSFAEVSATFRCSSDMREKLYFESWQRQSFNTQTWSMQYYEDYIGAVQIYQLDEKDNRKYGVELVEAFPKTIGAMTLDYSNGSEIHKLPVTFSYRWWKNLNDEADLPVSAQDAIAGILQNSIERNILANVPKVISRLRQ